MIRSPAARFALGIFFFGCWGEADSPPRESDAVFGDVGIGRSTPGENAGGDGFGGAFVGGGMPDSGGGPNIGDGPGANDRPGLGDQPGQTGGGPQNQGGGFGQDTVDRNPDDQPSTSGVGGAFSTGAGVIIVVQ